jgi:hypothetical protein
MMIRISILAIIMVIAIFGCLSYANLMLLLLLAALTSKTFFKID